MPVGWALPDGWKLVEEELELDGLPLVQFCLNMILIELGLRRS
jgi:hypothetical protein